MLKLKVLRRISIVPIKKMMRDLAESISSIRAEEILWPGLTHTGNVLILKCSASSKLQPVISQGFKNEGRKEKAWLRCFHLLAPQQHLTSKDSSFLLKSCFHSDPPHWKILSEMFSKIKINPQPISKYPFYNFQFFCFREHEIEPTQRKVENTLPLIFHFSKPIFYFCMKNSPVDNIAGQTTSWDDNSR